MKVSILLVVKDKEDSLRNTLYSISKQKTSFPFETCILDVNSSMDLESLIREFIPNAIYKKLHTNVDFIYTKGMCLNLASSDSDVIVIHGSDIIQTEDFVLEELCRVVAPKTISLAEVVDIPIKNDFYKNFNAETEKILRNWSSYIKIEKQTIDNIKYNISTRSSGKGHPSWLFCLGAIMKKDLVSMGFNKLNCDAVINSKMKDSGFNAVFPSVKGIHQRHNRYLLYCPIVDTCDVSCGRKTDHFKKVALKNKKGV